MSYQLKAEHRALIAQRLAAKVPLIEIAKELKHHRRSIKREIDRNSIGGIYEPVQAQKVSEKRRCDGRKKCRKMAACSTEKYVQQRLRKCWSPDQIAGRSKLDFPQDQRRQLSRELVYRWLKNHDHERALRVFLRRCRRRWRRHTEVSQSPIHALANRPAIVNERGRDGDWEMDTLVGPGLAVLLSMVERRSGFLSLMGLKQRRAEAVRQACSGRMTQLPAGMWRSVTTDNGSEFSQLERLQKSTGFEVYKTEPRSPWQRGSIENLNGLIRQFFPKGTRFSELTHYQIKQVEQLLNDRPRKRLGYRTPSEIFHEQCQRAFQT